MTIRFSHITLVMSACLFALPLIAEDYIQLDAAALEQADKLVNNPKLAAKTQVKVNTVKPKVKTKEEVLKDELIAKDKKINDLLAKLQKTQSRMHMAEAKAGRLSTMLEKNYDSTLSAYGKKTTAKPVSSQKKVVAKKKAPPIKKLPVTSSKQLQIATVSVEKANLRTGPGKNNSPIMTVSKGTRLAVETRLNDWYRVITPTGTRAWVSAEVVLFGRRYGDKPDRMVKVKGYQKNAYSVEEEARKLVERMQRK